jgi:hypothetical protein
VEQLTERARMMEKNEYGQYLLGIVAQDMPGA